MNMFRCSSLMNSIKSFSMIIPNEVPFSQYCVIQKLSNGLLSYPATIVLEDASMSHIDVCIICHKSVIFLKD